MLVLKMNVVRGATLGLLTGLFMTGCESENNESESSQNPIQTNEVVTDEFDGTWRANCFARRIFNVPEENQPDGFAQSALTIDSVTGIFSISTITYTDSQCRIRDSAVNERNNSGTFMFDGVTTTSSGLEATVIRYDYNGSLPDRVGLLYRQDDVLYRDSNSTTLIEDIVPNRLALNNGWQLVN